MYSFGRLEVPDARDMQFGIAPLLLSMPQITEKFWWDGGWWGNQGSTSQCVAYSWMHWLEDGPVIQDSIFGREKPLFQPIEFYHTCQLVDQWPGENYNGTSVRAGAKVLCDLGVINEYRWAFNIDEIINTLLTFGPMVVGTKWYKDMQFPDKTGKVSVKGRSVGGHAYLLNGVDVNKGYIRIKNSWGNQWGDNGYGYITIDDFEKVFEDGGEACIATEIKINEVPSLAGIKPI